MQFFLKKSKGDSNLIMMKIHDSQFTNRKFVYSTREFISLSKWDSKKQRPKPGDAALISRLLEIEKDATDYIRLNRKGLTNEGLRDYLNGFVQQIESEDKPSIPSLVKEWEEYHKVIQGTVKEKTFVTYDNSRKAFTRFMIASGHAVMKPAQFDQRMYNKLVGWLKTEAIEIEKDGKKIVEGFTSNSASKVLKHFKRFVIYLQKMGTKIGFDVEDIEFKEIAGLRIALPESELDKLWNHDFKDDPLMPYDKWRWIFLLQCYTGFRVSDLMRVNENINSDKTFIRFETQKVEGQMIEFPITPKVKEILKYFRWKVPYFYEQDYRIGIKAVYRVINPKATIQVRDKKNKFITRYIWQEISSHDAVRTFITMYAEKGVSVPAIANLTGKTVDVILKHYLVNTNKSAQGELLKASSQLSSVKTKRTHEPQTLNLFA